MKIQSLLIGLILTACVLSGCDDDLKYVGGTIQPDSDKVSVSVDSFLMQATTVKLDSIYAKSSRGFLGAFYDPQFGNYKSDFIFQFYCPDDFKFEEKPIDGKIDSVKLKICYNSYIGDSLSPMKVDVYPVIKSLDKNYYTNINPLNYADNQTSLGGKTYTTYKLTQSANRLDTIIISLNTEIGQKIYDETVNNPASFKNQDAFNRFFPGLYVTNTYGTGAVVEVTATEMNVYYSYDATMKGSNDQDSAYIAKGLEYFIVTDEIIQMNRMSSYNLDDLLKPNDNFAYLRTPAGVCTRLVIPAKEIANRVGDRIVNNFPLAIRTMPQSDWKYASTPPDALLLLPEDSLINFFENNRIDDNITSFKANYLTSSTENVKMYNFSNIARLFKAHRENNPDGDMNLLLVPVKLNYVSSQSTTYTISHWQRPSGVVLRKDDDVMKIKVTTSKFSD